jgi:hypothetical protein
LGKNPEGEFCSQTQDGQGPVRGISEKGGAVMSEQLAFAHQGATSKPDPKSSRPLSVLWCHWKPSSLNSFSVQSETRVGKMVGPTLSKANHVLGAVRSLTGQVSFT